jgi:hypothetical protein
VAGRTRAADTDREVPIRFDERVGHYETAVDA